jgi:signal peptidase II
VRQRRWLELWIAGLIVACDQLTKALILQRFELGESRTVVPGFFDLTLVHNTGAAFGFLNGVDFPFKSAVLVVVAVAALGAMGVYTTMLPAEQWIARLGLSLIIGGAAGNLVDRIRLGYVVDFVDLSWRGGWHFWAFNVADSAITVGVCFMVLDLLGVGRPRVPRAL